jgi:hypothetical protein
MENHGKMLMSSELHDIMLDAVDVKRNGTLTIRVADCEPIEINVLITYIGVNKNNVIEFTIENFDTSFATWMLNTKLLGKLLSISVTLQTNKLPNRYSLNEMSIYCNDDANCMLTLRCVCEVTI